MNPTVEQHLEAWASQSPTCVVTPSERRFIQDMRQAAMGGVGYGWMLDIIEVEWAWKNPGGSLSKSKLEAENARLRETIESMRDELNKIVETSAARDSGIMVAITRRARRAYHQAMKVLK